MRQSEKSNKHFRNNFWQALLSRQLWDNSGKFERTSSSFGQKDLGVIETQFARIMELETQVRISQENGQLGPAKRSGCSAMKNVWKFRSNKIRVCTIRSLPLSKRWGKFKAARRFNLCACRSSSCSMIRTLHRWRCGKTGRCRKLERRNVLTNIKNRFR